MLLNVDNASTPPPPGMMPALLVGITDLHQDEKTSGEASSASASSSTAKAASLALAGTVGNFNSEGEGICMQDAGLPRITE